jgi:hypothetical protein
MDGFRRGDDGELVPHKAEQDAIRDIVALRAQGRPLRAIADGRGVRISHEGVAGVLRVTASGIRIWPLVRDTGPVSAHLLFPPSATVLCSARRG